MDGPSHAIPRPIRLRLCPSRAYMMRIFEEWLGMRLAYVLTSLGMGGAERQVIAVAERMAGRGHIVSIVVLRPRLAEEWPTTLPVVHLEMRRSPAAYCSP